MKKDWLHLSEYRFGMTKFCCILGMSECNLASPFHTLLSLCDGLSVAFTNCMNPQRPRQPIMHCNLPRILCGIIYLQYFDHLMSQMVQLGFKHVGPWKIWMQFSKFNFLLLYWFLFSNFVNSNALRWMPRDLTDVNIGSGNQTTSTTWAIVDLVLCPHMALLATMLKITVRCDLFPDSKVHGANMGPTWVLSAPDGPYVGPMNLAIWERFLCTYMQQTAEVPEWPAWSTWQ